MYANLFLLSEINLYAVKIERKSINYKIDCIYLKIYRVYRIFRKAEKV